jgi:hypothetical protein
MQDQDRESGMKWMDDEFDCLPAPSYGRNPPSNRGEGLVDEWPQHDWIRHPEPKLSEKKAEPDYELIAAQAAAESRSKLTSTIVCWAVVLGKADRALSVRKFLEQSQGQET